MQTWLALELQIEKLNFLKIADALSHDIKTTNFRFYERPNFFDMYTSHCINISLCVSIALDFYFLFNFTYFLNFPVHSRVFLQILGNFFFLRTTKYIPTKFGLKLKQNCFFFRYVRNFLTWFGRTMNSCETFF